MENFEELLKKAENGDAEAQVKVGDCYCDGDGIEKNYTKAFEWYRKAAEQGNADGQNRLGMCFYKGIGIEKDYDKAFEWCEKAANLGNAYAQCALGILFYSDGRGVDKDEKKAFEWVRKAAEQGFAEAQNFLGSYYDIGIGVTRNKKEAKRWYKKAAEQGYELAKVNLGYNYVFESNDDLETKHKACKRIQQNIVKSKNLKKISVIISIVFFIVTYIVIVIKEQTFEIEAIVYSCLWIGFGVFGYLVFNQEYKDSQKELDKLLVEIADLENDRKAAEIGDMEAKERLKTKAKKKSIDDIVSELNAGHISDEHHRAKVWYNICLLLMLILLCGFAYFMHWNVTTINSGTCWQAIIVRVLISMSFLSIIFILMNQASRSRKTMVLLSKEIQEFKYIGALLKGKVGLTPDSEKTNKAIDKALDTMIKQHLYIQRKRLEKEDHSEVKDITPEVLTFFKDNTSSIMGNFNEMQKNILELQKTIVQTINNQKKE